MHTARHVMNSAPLVVGPRLPVNQLVHELSAQATDVACVVEDDRLVGVVTSADVCFPAGALRHPAVERFLSRDPEAVQGLVADWMSTLVETITPDTPIVDVIRELYGDQLAVLPVVGPEGRLLGAVTRKSVVKALAEGATSDEPRIFKQ